MGYLASVLGSVYNDLSSFSQSLPKRYFDALVSLKKNKSIKISPADKGGKTVILNSSDYVNKLSVLFSNPVTYKSLSANPLNKMQSAFNCGLRNVSQKYPEAESFIMSFRSFLPSLPYAYGLPKNTQTVTSFTAYYLLDWLALVQPFQKTCSGSVSVPRFFFPRSFEA